MDDREKMSWSVERRLEFIEFRLFWEGQINRGDICAQFNVSTPQASADLNQYREIAPNNIIYDASARAYVAGSGFKPVLSDPSARQYLSNLRLISDGAVDVADTWLGHVPSFDTVPLIRRRISPAKLRNVVQTIKSRKALRVQYHSLSRPDPTWRWLSPHALAFDGFRWHVRAWCHEREKFRDFVMARMIELRETRPSDVDPKEDEDWETVISLRIGPHPKLSATHRAAIELDYGMRNGEVIVGTRKCLAFYVCQQLGLDQEPEKIAPKKQQIVLLNWNEIEPFIRPSVGLA